MHHTQSQLPPVHNPLQKGKIRVDSKHQDLCDINIDLLQSLLLGYNQEKKIISGIWQGFKLYFEGIRSNSTPRNHKSLLDLKVYVQEKITTRIRIRKD